MPAPTSPDTSWPSTAAGRPSDVGRPSRKTRSMRKHAVSLALLLVALGVVVVREIRGTNPQPALKGCPWTPCETPSASTSGEPSDRWWGSRRGLDRRFEDHQRDLSVRLVLVAGIIVKLFGDDRPETGALVDQRDPGSHLLVDGVLRGDEDIRVSAVQEPGRVGVSSPPLEATITGFRLRCRARST